MKPHISENLKNVLIMINLLIHIRGVVVKQIRGIKMIGKVLILLICIGIANQRLSLTILEKRRVIVQTSTVVDSTKSRLKISQITKIGKEALL
jgi:hypothetical protein